MDIQEKSLELHEKLRGKLSIDSKVPVKNKLDMSLAYTPGVAEPCRYIFKNKEDVYKYTGKWNTVAIVTDGSAVLGLGDIGPEASLPVMEGKAVLFKEFGDVDAFPVCLDTYDPDEIVNVVKLMAPVYGGINLEDISSPRCVEIEEKLKKILDIPVFHDDQHGTAVVVAAALFNALKIVGKDWSDIRIAMSGAGAAGNAVSKFLLNIGIKDVFICNSKEIINKDGNYTNPVHKWIAENTNKENRKGHLKEALKDVDVFIGVSKKNIVDENMIKSMAKDPIVLPMANPDPEIMPDLAKKAGARIVGTGRSDFANQINNVIAFPGIFRGALDARASEINEEMKIAAAKALADLISDEELTEEYVIVPAFDERVGKAVAEAVKKAAEETGVARI